MTDHRTLWVVYLRCNIAYMLLDFISFGYAVVNELSVPIRAPSYKRIVQQSYYPNQRDTAHPRSNAIAAFQLSQMLARIPRSSVTLKDQTLLELMLVVGSSQLGSNKFRKVNFKKAR